MTLEELFDIANKHSSGECPLDAPKLKYIEDMLVLYGEEVLEPGQILSHGVLAMERHDDGSVSLNYKHEELYKGRGSINQPRP